MRVVLPIVDDGFFLDRLFDRLTGEGAPRRYRRLLVAPDALRASIVALIGAEAREPDGRVVMKMNGLTDPALIAALYGASQAGVEIDLIVRGICCLRPGVPGLSDRIRVRSLVGRYLEHSRIFRFGSERRGARYFIGSADMMGRNLDRRVEALGPVEDPQLRARLDEILALDLADDALAWELASDGTWKRVERARGLSASDRLEELARARAG